MSFTTAISQVKRTAHLFWYLLLYTVRLTYTDTNRPGLHYDRVLNKKKFVCNLGVQITNKQYLLFSKRLKACNLMHPLKLLNLAHTKNWAPLENWPSRACIICKATWKNCCFQYEMSHHKCSTGIDNETIIKIVKLLIPALIISLSVLWVSTKCIIENSTAKQDCKINSSQHKVCML